MGYYLRDYFIVPHDIVNTLDKSTFILPVFMSIRYNTTIGGKCLTSQKVLLDNCGYKFNSKSTARGHMDSIRDALNYLLQEDYIYDPVDATTDKPITSFDDISPYKFFTFNINKDLCNSTYGGFSIIYVDLYEAILKAHKDNRTTSLWRILIVFTFISMRIWNRTDVNYVAATKEQAAAIRRSNPEFYGCSVQSMHKGISKIYQISKSSLDKCICFLESNNIIHRKRLGNYICEGITVNLGSVIVLDSDMWEAEISGAAEEYRKRRTDYLILNKQKGEKVTAAS